MNNNNLEDAVHYHYGSFPPENLDFQRLLDPIAETTASLTRYDQMLATMHNNQILLAP